MAEEHAKRPEADVQRDDKVVASRETGGVPDPSYPDQNSTTGTTPNETFVGRVSGADPGYSGETGAERRARAAAQDGDGDGEGPAAAGRTGN